MKHLKQLLDETIYNSPTRQCLLIFFTERIVSQQNRTTPPIISVYGCQKSSVLI